MAIDPEAELRNFGEPAPASALGSGAPERARRILGALPAPYRRILELRFLHSLPIKEAAREMDVTVSNAKVLQHRALRRAALLPEEAP